MFNDSLILVIPAAVAFLIGLAKGGFGGMLGALAVPLMALVMPAREAIGVVLPILMFADVFAVASHWRKWNIKLVFLLIPGAILGVTIGTIFITNAPSDILRKFLGVIVLLFSIYKLLESRILKSIQYAGKNWHGIVFGTITGFSSSLAHTGGPPVSIYLLLQDIKPRMFIATSALFFMILNWIKVPFYLYANMFNFEILLGYTWLIPIVPLGVLVGRWFSVRVSKKVFEKIIVILLCVAGLMLLFT
ncbi:MAG: sulfite exporter TauE/SafE family protein [Anaerolineales bacterium]|jgi:uncharacterized membrane protein YfcA